IHQRSIEPLFAEIQRQTDYAVLYDDQLVSDQLITIKSQGADLNDVLEEAFAQTDLTYKVDGKQILVMARSDEHVRRQDTLITVQGTVRSDESPSQPIVGATVREVRTNRGVFTDENGRFSIRV